MEKKNEKIGNNRSPSNDREDKESNKTQAAVSPRESEAVGVLCVTEKLLLDRTLHSPREVAKIFSLKITSAS